MLALLRRVPTARDDRGITLTETLVTMLVLGFVLAAVMSLFTSSLRTASATNKRLEEIADGKIAVSVMTRSLRTAILPSQLYDTASTDTAAFIKAKPDEISFFANLENIDNTVGPSKVTYLVDAGGVLRESVQPPLPRAAGVTRFTYCDPNLASCAVKRRILARNVDLTQGSIFAYYNAMSVKLVGDPLPLADLESVDSVDVTLTVRVAGSGGNGTTYTSRVALPNHDAVIRSEGN